jgi:hypothetical protein
MFHHTVLIRAAREEVSEEIMPVTGLSDMAHKAGRFMFTSAPILERFPVSLGVRGDVAPAAAWPPAPQRDGLGS